VTLKYSREYDTSLGIQAILLLDISRYCKVLYIFRVRKGKVSVVISVPMTVSLRSVL